MVGLNANASFYQAECSNAKGTVTYSYGHVSNKLTVTKIDYVDNKQVKEVIKLDQRSVNMSLGDQVEINSDESSQCGGNGGGIFGTKQTYVVSLQLTNVDGSEFDSKISEVSRDGLSIETHLICELNINGRIACPAD